MCDRLRSESEGPIGTVRQANDVHVVLARSGVREVLCLGRCSKRQVSFTQLLMRHLYCDDHERIRFPASITVWNFPFR
jgi:hypothetical protein